MKIAARQCQKKSVLVSAIAQADQKNIRTSRLYLEMCCIPRKQLCPAPREVTINTP